MPVNAKMRSIYQIACRFLRNGFEDTLNYSNRCVDVEAVGDAEEFFGGFAVLGDEQGFQPGLVIDHLAHLHQRCVARDEAVVLGVFLALHQNAHRHGAEARAIGAVV